MHTNRTFWFFQFSDSMNAVRGMHSDTLSKNFVKNIVVSLVILCSFSWHCFIQKRFFRFFIQYCFHKFSKVILPFPSSLFSSFLPLNLTLPILFRNSLGNSRCSFTIACLLAPSPPSLPPSLSLSPQSCSQSLRNSTIICCEVTASPLVYRSSQPSERWAAILWLLLSFPATTPQSLRPVKRSLRP